MHSGTMVRRKYATNTDFVMLAASTFQWEDLSDDIVMDIGCGKEVYCASTILDKFPNVKSIIAIDASRHEIEETHNFRPQIKPVVANILDRNDIRPYEGKIDKVLSTYAIHQIPDKVKLFKNIYDLLKPKGQAAFLFYSDFGLYHVVEGLRLDSRFKDYYKGSEFMNFFSRQLRDHQYKEMLENIGFEEVKIEENEMHDMPGDMEKLKEDIKECMCRTFSVPPELVQEINNSAFNIYLAKFHDQESIYLGAKIHIFVTKPADLSSRCSIS